MSAQIQYGPGRRLTSDATRPSLLAGIAVLVIAGLAALPAAAPWLPMAGLVGGSTVLLVAGMLIPSRSEKNAGKVAHRLAQFRTAINLLGDQPTLGDLGQLLQLARSLDLPDREIAQELSHIQASIEGVGLSQELANSDLPIVPSIEPLPPGDVCHFETAVRFGRRRSDQPGRLTLSSGWLKFRGAQDVSIAWSEVGQVSRAGRDLIVPLLGLRRILRFSCDTVSAAARAGVISQHLSDQARSAFEPVPSQYHASL